MVAKLKEKAVKSEETVKMITKEWLRKGAGNEGMKILWRMKVGEIFLFCRYQVLKWTGMQKRIFNNNIIYKVMDFKCVGDFTRKIKTFKRKFPLKINFFNWKYRYFL